MDQPPSPQSRLFQGSVLLPANSTKAEQRLAQSLSISKVFAWHCLDFPVNLDIENPSMTTPFCRFVIVLSGFRAIFVSQKTLTNR
jgi:hypothetical protein